MEYDKKRRKYKAFQGIKAEVRTCGASIPNVTDETFQNEISEGSVIEVFRDFTKISQVSSKEFYEFLKVLNFMTKKFQEHNNNEFIEYKMRLFNLYSEWLSRYSEKTLKSLLKDKCVTAETYKSLQILSQKIYCKVTLSCLEHKKIQKIKTSEFLSKISDIQKKYHLYNYKKEYESLCYQFSYLCLTVETLSQRNYVDFLIYEVKKDEEVWNNDVFMLEHIALINYISKCNYVLRDIEKKCLYYDDVEEFFAKKYKYCFNFEKTEIYDKFYNFFCISTTDVQRIQATLKIQVDLFKECILITEVSKYNEMTWKMQIGRSPRVSAETLVYTYRHDFAEKWSNRLYDSSKDKMYNFEDFIKIKNRNKLWWPRLMTHLFKIKLGKFVEGSDLVLFSFSAREKPLDSFDYYDSRDFIELFSPLGICIIQYLNFFVVTTYTEKGPIYWGIEAAIEEALLRLLMVTAYIINQKIEDKNTPYESRIRYERFLREFEVEIIPQFCKNFGETL